MAEIPFRKILRQHCAIIVSIQVYIFKQVSKYNT